MISLVLYLIVILSPAFAMSSFTNKNMALLLPISTGLTIGFLFPFGLTGQLEIGTFIFVVISLVLLMAAILCVIKRKTFSELKENVFTCGMFWFMISLAILTIGIKGKLFDQWDEFSHWGDVIKATVDINSYSTNPASLSAFQSYPPGMVTFQYLFQKIHILVGGVFSEWRAYLSYDIFLLSFMAPMFSRLSIKTPLFSSASVMSILLLPTIFFHDTYYSLYIDVAVSCVFAFGIFSLLKKDEDERVRLLSLCTSCFLLPLLKDVGTVFSLFLLLLYCFEKKGEDCKYYRSYVACSAIIPLLLWKTNVKINKATEVFPFKYDMTELLRVILGGGEEYRQTVLKEFPRALVTKALNLGNTGISINYLLLCLLIAILTFFTINRYCTEKKNTIQIATPALLLFYIVGLHITYMFQFSEYEAIHFSSLERYLNIPLCGISIFLLYIWTDILNKENKKQLLLLLSAVAIAVPLNNTYSFLSREIVSNSLRSRFKYSYLDRKIDRDVGQASTIYLISQEDNGKDFWVMHYLVRPNIMNIGQLSKYSGFEAGGYSIGKPYYDGDIWSSDITPEELMDEWVEHYDYVAVLHTNNYLVENFSILFEEELKDNCLYVIDKNERIAVLVE